MKIKTLRKNPLSRSRPKDDEVEVKQDDDEGETVVERKTNGTHFPSDSNFNHIKCKAVRHLKAQKLKREKKKAKKESRKERIKEGAPKQIPHTIESLREKDETTIQGELDAEENAEVKVEFDNDEFASYYRHDYEPKVLITYSDNPTRKTRIFGRELTRIIPNSLSLYRNRSGVKKMVKSAVARGFTDLIVINENMSKPSILFSFHIDI